MKPRVIIAGGTGLVGQALTRALVNNGFTPIILTRSPNHNSNEVTYSHWEPHACVIDVEIFSGSYYIVNLTGENIGAKRWTRLQKKHIVDSRIKPTELLANTCAIAKDKPLACISMSASGFYGAVSNEHHYSETDLPINDFLANTCKQWENASLTLGMHAHRNVIMRLGIVLSDLGGALPKIALPVKMFAGFYIGTGRQNISWIHIDDLCRWIIYCIQNETISGIFNTATDKQVSNREFTRILCRRLHRPFIPIGIPRVVMRLLLGEMSSIVTEGCRISTNKLINTGFKFEYQDLNSALEAIYGRKSIY